jgi:hypothetical protein
MIKLRALAHRPITLVIREGRAKDGFERSVEGVYSGRNRA